jgi:hypothetical protein
MVKKLGSKFLVNTQATDQQLWPSAATLNNGGFVVTWIDFSSLSDGSASSIKAQLFDASGAKVGSEFLVNSSTANNQLQPEVTGIGGGNLVITWTDYSGTLGDTDVSSIKGQMFNAAGARLGSEFLVNTQTAKDQINPSVAGLSNGGFVVTWQDNSGMLGDPSGCGIAAQIFNNGGYKVGSEFLVNTATNGDQTTPRVASLANGGFVITWDDISGTLGDSSAWSIKAQIYNASGAKVGTEILVNTQTANNQLDPAITPLSNGGFVIAWDDYSGTLGDTSGNCVALQIFEASGNKVARNTASTPRPPTIRNTLQSRRSATVALL